MGGGLLGVVVMVALAGGLLEEEWGGRMGGLQVNFY